MSPEIYVPKKWLYNGLGITSGLLMIFAEQRRPLEVRTLRAVTDTRFAPYTLTVIVDGPRFTALLVPKIHDHGQSLTIELRIKQ